MFTDALKSILSVGGIAGVIGIIITGSICVRYVHDGTTDIPEVLSQSLSVIIGFYFGTAVRPAPNP